MLDRVSDAAVMAIHLIKRAFCSGFSAFIISTVIITTDGSEFFGYSELTDHTRVVLSVTQKTKESNDRQFVHRAILMC